MSYLKDLVLFKRFKPFFIPSIALILVFNANIRMQFISRRPARESLPNYILAQAKCFLEAEDYRVTKASKNITYDCEFARITDCESCHYFAIVKKTISGKNTKEKIIKYYMYGR